jgi:hypothetical protein
MDISSVIFNVMVVLAMGVGAYLALAAVVRMYDERTADFAKSIGEVIAAYFKSLQQKASAIASIPTSPAALLKVGNDLLKNQADSVTDSLKNQAVSVTDSLKNQGVSVTDSLKSKAIPFSNIFNKSK